MSPLRSSRAKCSVLSAGTAQAKALFLRSFRGLPSQPRGAVEGYGRVGSLLEVGTGFHPELTGRENIYLNGAILGMTRAEINRKFDEIVAFAEIEQFLDTPVKRYSSGMYVRLAFAVAAHLEPEILMVDEVLAVGDAAFQKKCLGKMGDVAKEGRTVLFVSHNMAAIGDLCSRAMLLTNGRVAAEGDTARIVSQYLQLSFRATTSRSWPQVCAAPGNEKFRLSHAAVRAVDGSPTNLITVRTPFVIECSYWNMNPGVSLNINIRLYNEQSILVFEAGPIHEPIWQPLSVGLYRDICHVPANLLNNGVHRVVLYAISNHGVLVHKEEDILIFDVHDTRDSETAGTASGRALLDPFSNGKEEWSEPVSLTPPMTLLELIDPMLRLNALP